MNESRFDRLINFVQQRPIMAIASALVAVYLISWIAVNLLSILAILFQALTIVLVVMLIVLLFKRIVSKLIGH